MAEPLASLPIPCRAVVVGASGGIGSALVTRLADASVIVHGFSRQPRLSDDDRIVPGILNVLDEESIAAAVAGLPGDPPLRLAIVASGLLHDQGLQPEKSLRALNAHSLARSFAINAIGPALVAKHVLPALCRDGKTVFAALSARVGSIEDNRLGGWYGYRASKAALNQLVRTLAIEQRRTRPQSVIVALHPGTVATALSAPFRSGADPSRLMSPDDAAAHILRVIDRLRPDDSGGFFAWDGQAIPF